MDLFVTCKGCGRLVHVTSTIACGVKNLCFACATLPDIDLVWPDLPKEEQYVRHVWNPEDDL
jgi:hypothetical protein